MSMFGILFTFDSLVANELRIGFVLRMGQVKWCVAPLKVRSCLMRCFNALMSHAQWNENRSLDGSYKGEPSNFSKTLAAGNCRQCFELEFVDNFWWINFWVWNYSVMWSTFIDMGSGASRMCVGRRVSESMNNSTWVAVHCTHGVLIELFASAEWGGKRHR